MLVFNTKDSHTDVHVDAHRESENYGLVNLMAAKTVHEKLRGVFHPNIQSKSKAKDTTTNFRKKTAGMLKQLKSFKPR